jgi:predicted transcriptional regulator
MVYPGRKNLDVLPEFVGTATVHQSLQQRERLRAFAVDAYAAGRSLREIAELTGRTQTAVRRVLDEAGVVRRGAGAQPIRSD